MSINKQKLAPVIKKHGIRRLAMFGSRARGTHRRTSDLDLLVSFTASKSLPEIVSIERELSRLLKVKVDLVTEGALSPYLKSEVRRTLKPIV